MRAARPGSLAAINTYVLGLVAIVAGLGAVTVAFVAWQGSAQRTSYRAATAYHFRTMDHCARITGEFTHLEEQALALLRAERTANHDTGQLPEQQGHVDPMPSLLAMERHLEAIARIQEEHGDAEFAPTIARAQRQFPAGRHVPPDHTAGPFLPAPGLLALLRNLEPFEFTIHQLEVLHAIEHETDLAALETDRVQGTRRLILFALASLTVGGVCVTRVLAGIRGAVGEQVRVEEELRENERTLKEAQELAHLGNWTWDLTSDTVRYSAEMYRILGVTPDQLGQTLDQFAQYVHPDDREVFADGAAAIQEQATGGVGGLEYRICRPDGSERVVFGQGRTTFDEAGRPLQMVGTIQDVTERQRAAAALRESEATSRLLLETAPLGIAACDTDGRITFTNAHFVELVGAQSAEAIAAEVNALTHPVIVEAGFADMLRECMTTGRSLRHEQQYTTSYGRDLTVRLHAAPYRDAAEAITGCLVIFEDVTAQTKVAAALAESEARLTKSQEIAHLGHWDWDITAGTLHWSDEVYRIFGVAPQEFGATYEAFMRFVHPGDRTAVQGAVDAALDAGEPYAIDHRVMRHDGSQRWVHEQGEVFRDDAGRPIRMMGVVQDITEQRRAGEALRDSEAQLRKAQEIAHLGPWEWDMVANTFHFSEAFCDLFGTTPAELGSSLDSFLRFVHPADRDSVTVEVARALDPASEETDPNLDYRAIRADGAERTMHVSAETLFDEEGRAVRMVGATQDVTARKQVEAELRAHRLHLEEMVAARTTELKAVNAELESFCYSVSHDLRAPLRAIAGFSAILMEDYADRLDDEGRHSLERVRAGTQRMDALITDLLELSRVTRADLKRTTVDLSDIGEEIVAEFHEAAPEAATSYVIQPNLHAYADPRLMRAVLTNLLDNARKYTSKREDARVTLGQANGETGEKRPTFFVQDNGAGFDMAYADKLFGPFQRLHSPAEFPGTGVGLATVQRIIHRHGGEVWAEGAPGEGATFYFTLPGPMESTT